MNLTFSKTMVIYSSISNRLTALFNTFKSFSVHQPFDMGSEQSVLVANAFPQDIFVRVKTERITVV